MYLCLVLISIATQAQDRDRDRDQDRIHEYLLLKDGKLLQVNDRDQVQLRQSLVLLDGSIVNADGSYTNSAGDRIRLHDGECLDMDGNKYISAEQFNQQLQLRQQAMNQLHFVFKDGKTFQRQNEDRTQLRERITLKDGGYLNADGSFRLRDQQQMRLRDGECLDPDGNLYGSEAQFRNYMRQRLQANAQEHFLFQNGKMFRVQNTQQNQLNERLNLQSGLVVNPDGSFLNKTKDRIQLRNGECIDPDGNLYASQVQLRDQAMIRLQAMNQEHFIYQNGQLFRAQNQEQKMVTEKLTLYNGLIINPDGTFQAKNKNQERLANGECLDTEGIRYKNQAEFHQQTQNRLQAMAEPHFLFQDGKLYRTGNQARLQVQDQWKLQNGTIVNPDGSYQLKNGKKEQMRNGELLDQEGRKYESRERFREKMEFRVRDRMEMRDRDLRERRNMQDGRKRIGR